MKNKFPAYNKKDSLFNYAKENPFGCIDRFKIKPFIRWYKFEEIIKGYSMIIADPLRDKEPESYKYIIIFDPQTLEKCTFDADDIAELKRKYEETYRDYEETHKKNSGDKPDNKSTFNLIKLLERKLLEINITFKDLNSLRRHLPNNSYNKVLKDKKLFEINENFLHSLYLLRFRKDARQKYYEDFFYLNRALNKKTTSFGFFTKIAENVFIDFNIRAFRKVLPPTARDVNITNFYSILHKNIESHFRVKPPKSLYIPRTYVVYDPNNVFHRVHIIIEKIRYKWDLKLERARVVENLQRNKLPILPLSRYEWVDGDPLITFILEEFEKGFYIFYIKYRYLNVNPDDAFINFYKDVITPERIHKLLPGVDLEYFKQKVAMRYTNRFYLPNLYKIQRAKKIYRERYLEQRAVEVVSAFLPPETKKDITVTLSPSELFEDALVDFYIKFDEIHYIIKGLKSIPSSKYRKDRKFINKNFNLFMKLLNNPYKNINELEFFKYIAENGHDNPLVQKINPEDINSPDKDDDDEQDKKNSKTEENQETVERTTDFVKSVGEFVSIHTMNQPPLSSEVCNTSVFVPDHKKIRIYKIYVGFLMKNKKTGLYEHLFIRPITINLLTETVDSYIKGLQKKVYEIAAQVDDLRDVERVTTYVYYIGPQDSVREYIKRNLLTLSKKIGYHWLGVGTENYITRKGKILNYFTLTFLIFLILSNIEVKYVLLL